MAQSYRKVGYLKRVQGWECDAHKANQWRSVTEISITVLSMYSMATNLHRVIKCHMGDELRILWPFKTFRFEVGLGKLGGERQGLGLRSDRWKVHNINLLIRGSHALVGSTFSLNDGKNIKHPGRDFTHGVIRNESKSRWRVRLRCSTDQLQVESCGV